MRLFKNRQFFIWISASVLWLGFIFGNSLQPGEESAQSSNFFVEIAYRFFLNLSFSPEREDLSFWIRKGAHFTEYLILAVLVTAAFFCLDRKIRNHIGTIWFILLFCAVSDEMIQRYVEGRSSEVRDVLVDFAGGMTGFLIVAGFIWLLFRRRKKKQKKLLIVKNHNKD